MKHLGNVAATNIAKWNGRFFDSPSFLYVIDYKQIMAAEVGLAPKIAIFCAILARFALRHRGNPCQLAWALNLLLHTSEWAAERRR